MPALELSSNRAESNQHRYVEMSEKNRPDLKETVQFEMELTDARDSALERNEDLWNEEKKRIAATPEAPSLDMGGSTQMRDLKAEFDAGHTRYIQGREAIYESAELSREGLREFGTTMSDHFGEATQGQSSEMAETQSPPVEQSGSEADQPDAEIDLSADFRDASVSPPTPPSNGNSNGGNSL